MNKIEHAFFESYFIDLNCKINSVDLSDLEKISNKILSTSENGNKVIVAGNGGSAAMASHFSVDLTKAAGVRSINFNESDLITCFANDYGYENWLVEAVRSYADKGDILVLISSSGNSANIINCAQFAVKNDIHLITLSGFSPDNYLRKLGHLNLWCDSHIYNIVELTHQTWLLGVVDFIINAKNS